MSYLRLSDEGRREAIFSLAREKTELSLQSSVGVMRGLAELMDSLMKDVYRDLHFVEEQLNIDTARGFYLDNFGRMLDLPRQEETPTRITLRVSLNLPDVQSLSIPQGAKVFTGQIIEVDPETQERRTEETGIEFNAAEDFELDNTRDITSGELQLVSNITGLRSRPPENSILTYDRPGDELVEQEIEYDGINTAIELGTDRWDDAYYRNEIQNHWKLLIQGDISAHYEAIAKQFIFDARIERISSTTYSNFILWISTKNGADAQNEEREQIRVALDEARLITTRISIQDAEHYFTGETRDTIEIAYDASLDYELIEGITQGYLHNLRIGEAYYESELYNRFDAAGIASNAIHIVFDHPVVQPGDYERFLPQIRFSDGTESQ